MERVNGSQKELPRGIKNNNPGNIRMSSVPWIGQAGKDSHGMVIFSSSLFGIRALGKNLKTYQEKYGINTIHGFISRWAPPGNEDNNNTKNYIHYVSNFLDIKEDKKISITNPEDLPLLQKLVKGIIMFENGMNPYTDEEIMKGLTWKPA